MLRNPEIAEPVHDAKDVLNEVLSLNAQECATLRRQDVVAMILNEVLSLNAQESPPRSWPPTASAILNEVLSLNAQEFDNRGLL